MKSARKYKVILPFEVDGREFKYGEIAEFDIDTAAVYATSLIAVEEGK